MDAPQTPKFRRLRWAAGLTQMELAQKSGVHVQKIRRIEAAEIRMENVTLKNAVALAAALGVEPGELMDDAPPDAQADAT